MQTKKNKANFYDLSTEKLTWLHLRFSAKSHGRPKFRTKYFARMRFTKIPNALEKLYSAWPGVVQL